MYRAVTRSHAPMSLTRCSLHSPIQGQSGRPSGLPTDGLPARRARVNSPFSTDRHAADVGPPPKCLSMDKRKSSMILVTGATGNVGRELVKLLLAEGVQVAAITRDPANAALPADTHIIGGDPSHPTTLASALNGVQAIFLVPRAVGDAAAELLSLAAKQGVQRVVMVSAVTVEYGGGYKRFAEAFKAVEDSIKDSR